MEPLIINNRLIEEDVYNIIKDLQRILTNGKLRIVKKAGPDVEVCCPSHKNGKESRPSCFVNIGHDELPPGSYHCFTCQSSGQFDKFVAECMDVSIDKARQWLVDNYATDYVSEGLILPEIKITKKMPQREAILDESVLESFEPNHPYFKQRKLTDEIVEKFELKYDPKTECVVFPVRDVYGRLIGLTRRKVKYKRYELPNFVNKPVYLLYNILKDGIKNVAVCESQVNALYLWSLKIPAVAMFGTGTKYQYDLLNKSGIISYTLVLDGDDAGRKGVERFKANVKGIIDVIEMPDGKDINDFEPDVVKSLFS